MLLQRFIENLEHNFNYLAAGRSRVLVAVSGGIDSVVLVDLFFKANVPFAIAHCNFRLRGEESGRDERFVKELAQRYDKELFVAGFDTNDFAAQNKLSIQEAARRLRYDWFAEVVSSQQSAVSRQQPSPGDADIATTNNQPSIINCIATAHHANDNIETLLINLFRGTGIHGLHGILPKQNNIIRPLLFAKREEITSYAAESGLSWVEDSSNASDKYTRNFFRHQLLPLVMEAFPNAEDNLLQNIHRFSEAGMLYQQAIDAHKKKLVEVKGTEWHIPVLKLQKTQPLQTILWEIVKDFRFTSLQMRDIQNLLTAENGKYVSSPSHRIIRNRAWLVIAPQQTEEAQHILIEKTNTKITYQNGTITSETIQHSANQIQPSATAVHTPDNNTALIDAKHIRYPLLLRKWKPGDYFYPLGMRKKKKLSRFFIDLKLSKTDKENVWVIEADKKIIWVVGYRIDDRCKVTGSTKEILIMKQKTGS